MTFLKTVSKIYPSYINLRTRMRRKGVETNFGIYNISKVIKFGWEHKEKNLQNVITV